MNKKELMQQRYSIIDISLLIKLIDKELKTKDNHKSYTTNSSLLLSLLDKLKKEIKEK